MDQVCDMLQPTEESEQYFTKEQLEEIKKAVSMQLIATNTFVETFQEQNKTLAEKLKKEQEQEMAAKLEKEREEREAAATAQKQTQMDGQPIEVANGLSQKMQEQPQQRITVNTSIENFRKAEQLQTQEQIEKKEVLTSPATPVSGQEPEQPQQDSTPAPQEVLTKTSAEPSAEEPQPKITANFDVKHSKEQTVEKQKEDKNQQKDASLNNGPEADSSIESSTDNENTRQQIKKKIFHEGGLDSKIQRQKAEAQKNPNQALLGTDAQTISFTRRGGRN